jgi:YD repeat-containing protein
LGLLTKEYQEHAGTKDGSTLYVEYDAVGRRSAMTDPDGGRFTCGDGTHRDLQEHRYVSAETLPTGLRICIGEAHLRP